MITVHHLNSSRSQRILWLLEELKLDYTIKHYERNPKTLLAPPALRAVHPLGKSPVITDGEVTVAESGAIVEYLLDQYDGRSGGEALRPGRGTAEGRRFIYWLHFAEGSLMPPLLLKLVFGRLPKQPLPFFIRPIVRGISQKVLSAYVDPQLKTYLDYLESELSQRTWFTGDQFSAADIQMSFPIEAAEVRSGIDSTRPRLMAFLDRIRARPAYQKALEKGGPYKLIF